MCREFGVAAAPPASGPATGALCVIKFDPEFRPEDGGRTKVREEDSGPPRDGKGVVADDEAAPKKSAPAPPAAVVSFAAIGDSCGSSLLLHIGRKMPCPPLGPVLANPLRSLVSSRDSTPTTPLLRMVYIAYTLCPGG